MEEKLIIEGKIKANRLFDILLKVGIGIVLVGLIFCAIRLSTGTVYKSFYKMRMPYKQAGFSYIDLLFCALCFELEAGVGVLIYLGVVVIIVSIVIYFMMNKCEICVTDKRVIGKVNFGKRVDLPLNQISAVSQGMLSSIAIATSSGRIHFWCIENRNEVFDEISKLIRNYQIQKTDVNSAGRIYTPNISNADELRKYKELLDMGAITQEEYDAKKKQLLGL